MSFYEWILDAAISAAHVFIKNPQKRAALQHLVDELADLLDQIRTPKSA